MVLAMDNNEVPTVEQLLGCPISRFIQFATNDCGYEGSCKELIANYILSSSKLRLVHQSRTTQTGAKPRMALFQKSTGKPL